MTINSFLDVLRAAPFQPFTIRLADGRSVEVPHPDFVTVTGGGRTAIVSSQVEKRYSIVDLLLVTQLEVGASSTPAS